MLVLTRKIGEKIVIGQDITITVVDIGKARVRLGIEAPAGHRILRSELVVYPEPPAAQDEPCAGVLRTQVAAARRTRQKATETVGV